MVYPPFFILLFKVLIILVINWYKFNIMRYINPNSNRGLVNKMADFILKKLTLDYDSVIEVTDCGKFFIVNGMTNCKDILDMSKVRDEFVEQNKDIVSKFGYENLNVIDLLMYDVELEKKSDYSFILHNTERPSFSKQIKEFLESTDLNVWSISDNNGLEIELDYSETKTPSLIPSLIKFSYSPLTVSSEFPYGHSLNMGRLHYYYSEYVCNHLFNVIKSNKINFKISTNLNEEEDFDIELYSETKHYPDKVVKSLVLDVFDFKLDDFKYLLSSYDLSEDLDKPFSNKPWLIRDKLEELIIM